MSQTDHIYGAKISNAPESNLHSFLYKVLKIGVYLELAVRLELE